LKNVDKTVKSVFSHKIDDTFSSGGVLIVWERSKRQN